MLNSFMDFHSVFFVVVSFLFKNLILTLKCRLFKFENSSKLKEQKNIVKKLISDPSY